ncbi:MAG: LemA family protein [Candidatus Acididesulfobacter diazotrophicus]|uniref:LemA family protein n=1 Tax=Candidatus Acididesulfobacter diazotrophicus TaxID=2597226 RepID=A0A519BQN9_9DELT|nr:MAG: LemA family protein [Candidatus Acididesulfobacter diazotrophicus]
MIWPALIIIVFAIIILIYSYNLLISRRNAVQYAFASIDALLKKRFDLIPNLVSSAKEYMNYEKYVLNQLTQMRTQFKAGSLSPQELDSLDTQSNVLIKGIFATAENYPDLKASQNILQLQAALNEVEEQISAARRAFNAAVMEYNNAVNHFPSNIIANAYNFKFMDSFSIPEGERQKVDVKQLFKDQ